MRHREALLLEQQHNQSKLFGGSFKKHVVPQTIDKNLLSVGSPKPKSPQRRAEADEDFVRDPASGSREGFAVEGSASPKKSALHAPMEKRLFDGLQSKFSGLEKTNQFGNLSKQELIDLYRQAE